MSFDRIAPHYYWLETAAFGSVLQRARTHWIDRIASPKRVVIFGQGNGRFLCEFLRIHRSAIVDCLDASERMLQLARERVCKFAPEALDRIRFMQEDIRAWYPTGRFDLLVCNFFLDCFDRNGLDEIVRKIAEAATPKAYLFLADFSIPRNFLARAHAKFCVTTMYSFFRAVADIRATELIDPTSALEANGFNCLSQAQWRFGLVRSGLWQRGQ